MIYVRLLISGLVTGVGFRSFIKRNAEELSVAGWVRNRIDGKVEAVFEGEEKKVQEMLKLCKNGPPAAKVEKAEILERKEIEKKSDEFQVLF